MFGMNMESIEDVFRTLVWFGLSMAQGVGDVCDLLGCVFNEVIPMFGSRGCSPAFKFPTVMSFQ